MKSKTVKIKKEKQYFPLNRKNFFTKFANFVYYKHKDFKADKGMNRFKEFGLTIYCGMQGDGKTVSMVERLEEIRHQYPKVKIATNFGYIHQDFALTDWLQILEERNGEDGIVFAIDEIQNEFNVYDTRNFSENLLRTVTQQRKQAIKIYATSQHFNRVAKPLREQTFEVVDCFTFFGRWTFQKCFSADEYNVVIDNPERKQKLHRKWRKNFVQNDYIRTLNNSYEVIQSMVKLEKEERKKEKVVGIR